MSKASDTQLGILHGKLTKTMLDALEASEVAIILLEEYEDQLPSKVIDFLEKHALTNPALLTTVARFLKDNSITCAIEDDNQLSELEQRLTEKRQRKVSVSNVVTLEDELF